jgi:copper chaperone CopZ
MTAVVFEVEQAGCESCAARVRAALEPLTDVGEIAIDAEADRATVRASGELTQHAVDGALEAASHGSGHLYRVSPGSWREEE